MDQSSTLPTKYVSINDEINKYGEWVDSSINSLKIKYSNVVLEYSEDLGMTISSIMAKHGLNKENVSSFVNDGFDNLIDDANSYMEKQRKELYDALDFAKSEIETLKQTKLDPSEVKGRIDKIKYSFSLAMIYIDDSFIDYNISEFTSKFFNRFEVDDFDIQREIKNQINLFSDNLMDKYKGMMKEMQGTLINDFDLACEQIEIGLNQEQKVTEALDHPEDLKEEDVLIYAEGKSQEELTESYDNARERILSDLGLTTSEQSMQLESLNRMYSQVLSSDMPSLEVKDSFELGGSPDSEFIRKRESIINDSTLTDEEKSEKIIALNEEYATEQAKSNVNDLTPGSKPIL